MVSATLYEIGWDLRLYVPGQPRQSAGPATEYASHTNPLLSRGLGVGKLDREEEIPVHYCPWARFSDAAGTCYDGVECADAAEVEGGGLDGLRVYWGCGCAVDVQHSDSGVGVDG